jgi:hypothetical protein
MEFTPGKRNVKITYNGKPFRVQVPKMRCSGKSEYGGIELDMCHEFSEFWDSVDSECREWADPSLMWRLNVNDGKFRVKIDEKTHIFDSNSKLVSCEPNFHEKIVTCILEIKSVYKFNGYCGVTCRVHQIKVHESECQILDSE